VADASLVVDERKQKGDFTVVTKVSGPVYVTFTSPRDNNSLVKSTVNDIAKIVEKFLESERRKGNQVGETAFSAVLQFKNIT
jgi:redox-regulated HSP33 family molecular chaperone